MATPAGFSAASLPGDLDFSAGGLAIDWLTGTFVKAPVRNGNVLEVTYQDGNGDEQTMRFIGAPRQPIVGVRRLAYIPDGETPTEAHFLVAGKSASSTTERLPVAGITGVSNHHVAVWYAATLPEMDLFTSDNTIRNYRTSFGEPMALEVDGVDGFYHVTGSLTRQDVPSQNFDAFYAESRDGEILTAVYGGGVAPIMGQTSVTFTEATFTGAITGAAAYSTHLTMPIEDVPPIRYTTAFTLPVTDTDIWTGDDAQSEVLSARFSQGARGQARFRSVPTYLGDRYSLIGIPDAFGDINSIFQSLRSQLDDWERDATNDITIDGVDYKVWRTTNTRLSTAITHRETFIQVLSPFDSGHRWLGIAVPVDHAPLEVVRPGPGFSTPSAFSSFVPPNLTFGGVEYAIRLISGLVRFQTVNEFELEFGEEPL